MLHTNRFFLNSSLLSYWASRLFSVNIGNECTVTKYNSWLTKKSGAQPPRVKWTNHLRHINFCPPDGIWILPQEINRLWLCFWQREITKNIIRICICLFTKDKRLTIFRFCFTFCQPDKTIKLPYIVIL